jgi:hypothetical protein
MNPLHATIEEFAAEGYTHVSCHCPRRRITRMWPMSWLPEISMGLTLADFAALGAVDGYSQSSWRLADELGKPQGRRS